MTRDAHRALDNAALEKGNAYDMMHHTAWDVTVWTHPPGSPIYNSDLLGYRAWPEDKTYITSVLTSRR